MGSRRARTTAADASSAGKRHDERAVSATRSSANGEAPGWLPAGNHVGAAAASAGHVSPGHRRPVRDLGDLGRRLLRGVSRPIARTTADAVLGVAMPPRHLPATPGLTSATEASRLLADLERAGWPATLLARRLTVHPRTIAEIRFARRTRIHLDLDVRIREAPPAPDPPRPGQRGRTRRRRRPHPHSGAAPGRVTAGDAGRRLLPTMAGVHVRVSSRHAAGVRGIACRRLPSGGPGRDVRAARVGRGDRRNAHHHRAERPVEPP